MIASHGGKSSAVVLLSGGTDSCVCAALAARDHETSALHISYGQRTETRERESFLAVCDRLNIGNRLMVRNEALKLIGGSALTDANIGVPESHAIGRDIPVTYVPFRNAHFLSVAVSWAEVLDATKIYIGAVEQDSSGYPDCRPDFIAAFQQVILRGTKSGIERGTPALRTPLIDVTKGDIIRRGVDLGVDYGLTHSCYDPTPDGRACGHCDSCILRRRGFEEAGVDDPTVYA